ncbi:transcriptional regulator [Vibrio ishigakensis]|uniref:Transcriptional regulator n=1 Tax=Vibrio ishigakensis TaxID=1481914 RepID=A0A0B8QPG2_9VIBR|nr:TetR/AcrR family transcriptional regulator [Vibrio ishigakensis]GAM57037.1 transcriptional regulator, tetR family [Vibrio ishigakensis]GAM65970.1 transcriptional regulator [Vibrio ishigakensis]GAM72671.1 transcriptional regulator [Vibrio sp. JCM 19236]GAM78867.1 transcriptional regulator [Vibrio ishigakensis]
MATNNKRQDILDAATAILARDGFNGLSIQKLAKEAKMAAGTVYLYFKDKDSVIAEVRLWLAKQIADAIQKDVDDSQPLKKQYETMCHNIWSIGGSGLGLLKTRIQYESLPTPLDKEITNTERSYFYKVDEMFKKGRSSGEFLDLPTTVLFSLSLESCVALTRKHFQQIEEIDANTFELAIQASWKAIQNR